MRNATIALMALILAVSMVSGIGFAPAGVIGELEGYPAKVTVELRALSGNETMFISAPSESEGGIFYNQVTVVEDNVPFSIEVLLSYVLDGNQVDESHLLEGFHPWEFRSVNLKLDHGEVGTATITQGPAQFASGNPSVRDDEGKGLDDFIDRPYDEFIERYGLVHSVIKEPAEERPTSMTIYSEIYDRVALDPAPIIGCICFLVVVLLLIVRRRIA